MDTGKFMMVFLISFLLCVRNNSLRIGMSCSRSVLVVCFQFAEKVIFLFQGMFPVC